MPRWPEKEVNAAEQPIGQAKELIIPSSGEIIRNDQELEVADVRVTNGDLDAMKFMEEPVEVMVHESTDQNADNPVHVACNGINQYFWRGQAQVVKRKYVEILARAKQTAMATREIRNYDGELSTQVTKSTALRYPFSIISDSNPKGSVWLKAVLAEG